MPQEIIKEKGSSLSIINNVIPLDYLSSKSCCRLGEELYREKHIITQSPNFFSIPSLGPMGIGGYLLLCSKKHYLGYCSIPTEILSEFETFFSSIKKRLKELYDSPTIAFEHGPKCKDGFSSGNSIDHAHIHILPTNKNIMSLLLHDFIITEIDYFHELNKYSDKTVPYLFFEDQKENRYLLKPKKPLESQFLRKVICKAYGRENWNWKENFDLETFLDTLTIMRGDNI
jgi:diadenosine tetraphosphate (Ap4A) HIT family hydrolase